jgi:copper chaperone CopZ
MGYCELRVRWTGQRFYVRRNRYSETMIRALLLFSIAAAARAEFLDIKVFIRDMNCESCSDTLRGSLKRLRGVEDAEVDFKAGTVAVKLASQNRLGPDQIWDAIKRVGFTPGATDVRVRGSVKDGKFEVAETGKTFEIDGHAVGENVEIKGSTAPPPDPRTPIRIKVAE